MIEKFLQHKRYYVYFEGGLGDILLQYFKYECLPFLKELKERQPDTYVKAILSTHNSMSGEIFRYHPYIDEVELHTYAPDYISKLLPLLHYQGYTSLRDIVPGSAAPAGSHDLYLSDNDMTYVKSVLVDSPYTCVHPFAGKQDFKAERAIDWKTLLAQPENIVIIGGDSAREFVGREKIEIREAFTSNQPNVINLVNIANPRIASYIAMHAKYFIGTLSCYVCVAAYQNVPGTCYIPGWLNDDFTELVKQKGYTRVNL